MLKDYCDEWDLYKNKMDVKSNWGGETKSKQNVPHTETY